MWKNKITILFFIIIFFSLSVIYLHLTPNSYKVELTIVPVEEQSLKSQSNSALAGLAGLADISLKGKNSIDSFELYRNLIKSRVLSDILSENKGLMRIVFEDQWNASIGSWEEPQKSFLNYSINVIKYMVGINVQKWSHSDGRLFRISFQEMLI